VPGFLSRYEGVNRVYFDEEYWVDLKKTLTEEEIQDAEQAGMRFEVVVDPRHPDQPRTEVRVDPKARLTEMILASIITWNLTDSDGNLLPVEHDRNLEQARKTSSGGRGDGWKSPRRKTLEKMYHPVMERLAEEVGPANAAPSREESRSFPDGNGSRLHGGQDQAPDAGEVLHGDGVLAEAGDSGGPPAPI
jgi:hypothetical protein